MSIDQHSVDFSRETIRHELVRRQVTVQRTTRLTSTILRVTLGGQELAGFAADGPEDHVKLFFGAAEDRVSRDYTPARYSPEAQELDIDFVLHGGSGPASRFALDAAAGDALAIGGPRGSRRPPRGADRFVLLADEAALPAMSRWIDAVRDRAAVFAFVQSEHDDVLDYPIPSGDRVAVTRISPGAEAALSALGGPGIDATTYVWAAGEATALIPVRRHLRRERGIPKEQAKVDGYWRIGAAGLDHHAPLDPAEPEAD